ncbi:nucleoside recognition protein [Desulfobulbus sp.]|uniref:nucleoside recognition protein n=1 Tax=Desulfobulbus sp. TaxID=895 RepID=UPI00286F0FDA|nr:nucleoside recognition protein [Desulfobulbus sp.]
MDEQSRLVSRLRTSCRSSVASALLILKYVVPLHIAADLLLYFDALRPLTVVFAPLTALFDLPPEAAMALAGGVLLNIYAGIAFAAPLGLTPYQWTILGVFLGVCHSMLVECAVMSRLGIATVYSVVLRTVGACLAVVPVLMLPASLFGSAQQASTAAAPQYAGLGQVLVHSLGSALILAAKIILLISAVIVAMDLLQTTALVRRHLARVNTALPIIAGQLLGITYGAGILLHEADRGVLSREDIFYIGTFLMICHSLVEDVLLFVLFGASYWVIIGVRLSAALLLSSLLLRLFRTTALGRVVRR